MSSVETISAKSRPDNVATLKPRLDRTQSRSQSLIPDAEELFRALYTTFGRGPGMNLAVCSAVTGEGKTTIALGLAVTIAQDFPGRRVVVVETDLWRAVLAKDFGLPASPGLVDCLHGRDSVAAALRPTSLENLSLLVAGGPVVSPQRLLRSARMPEVVEALRESHDVVIVDTPAALAHSEVALIARMVDEIVFVVRTGVTPAHELDRALQRVQGANLHGIIVNDSRTAVPSLVRRLVRL